MRKRGQSQISTLVTAVAPDDRNPFGGIHETEIRDLAARYANNDSELSASEFSIALESVARAISARMDHQDYAAEPKRLTIFLISDRPRELAERIGAVSEPILDNGSRSFCGCILVAPATCHSGYGYALNGTTNAELFQEVVDKGAGEEIALVFDPNATEKEIRYYPKGLALPEMVQRFSFRTMNFTVQMLDSVLKRLHDEILLTPDAAKGLDIWERASNYWPIKDCEARLQGLMKLTLTVAFDTRLFSVMWEVPGTQGRCDLFVIARDTNENGRLTAHAVIELKVLRSFSSGGSRVAKKVNADAIKKGVLQARGYRDDRHALHAMLCCYDMRKPIQSDGDKCFDPIRKGASRNAVHLRCYRLYRTADDLRKDRMST